MIFKIINDNNVSLEGKGLWMYLTTLTDDYPIGDSDIYKCGNDSRETIKAATQELIKTGYIVKNTATNREKTVRVYVYTINYGQNDHE